MSVNLIHVALFAAGIVTVPGAPATADCTCQIDNEDLACVTNGNTVKACEFGPLMAEWKKCEPVKRKIHFSVTCMTERKQ